MDFANTEMGDCPIGKLFEVHVFLFSENVLLEYTDALCLGDYNIGPDTKIHLVVRRPEASEDLTSTSRIGKSSALWDELNSLLQKHFTLSDAEKVMEQFKKVQVMAFLLSNIICSS